jgi:L-alanine-DL-glutamate epimerase-like enolase superfamily enzyme
LAAPVRIAYTHVHSLRLTAGSCAGAEALAARVRLDDGTLGYGFTLNDDAGLARDMAAWDALGRSKGVALPVLLGGFHRDRIRIEKDDNPAIAPDWPALRKGILDNKHDLLRIDPFAWGSLEQVVTIAASAAAFDLGVALLAPNAHPWELQYCAALAATFRGDDTRIIVRIAPERSALEARGEPGVGIDWSFEPAFGKIQWQG